MPDTEVVDLSALLESIEGGDFQANATRKLAKLVETMRTVARNAGGAPKGKMTISIFRPWRSSAGTSGRRSSGP